MASVSTDQRRGTNASAAIKVPCVCATTANITLSAEQTIDGITTSETRVLVKDQTDASENGIYCTGTGAWVREPDWNGAYDVQEGTLIFVSRGTVNAQTLWRVSTTGDITIGTTNVAISQQGLAATAILSDGSVGMAAHWVASTHNTYDIGEDSTPKRWRHGYLEGNLDVDGTGNFEGALTVQNSVHYDNAIQYLDVGADVASAGALTLGTDGNFFDITGTTAITSIGTLGVGTCVTLQFDGALTLTHHATDLILPDAANITTYAGYIATFYEYASGDWRMVSDNRRKGSIVQVVNDIDGAVNTGPTTMPYDTSIPQNTEGDEYMTLAIVPTSTTNNLKIEVTVFASTSVGNSNIQAALFQDSTAGALASASHFQSNATTMVNITFTHWMAAGTTSSTTFKVRIGSDNAGTTTFNGQSGAVRHGGVMASSITITEIKA